MIIAAMTNASVTVILDEEACSLFESDIFISSGHSV